MKKRNNKRVQFGKLLTGSFEEKTLNFQMEKGFYMRGGKYALVLKDDFDKMVQSLEECTTTLVMLQDEYEKSFSVLPPAMEITKKIKS